jgi:hypothetical protein
MIKNSRWIYHPMEIALSFIVNVIIKVKAKKYAMILKQL